MLRAHLEEGTEPTRRGLQDLGNQLRQEHGPDYLARTAITGLAEMPSRLAVDGIRNTGEIEYLRDAFGDSFFLVAVHAPAPVRWNRERSDYVKQGLDEQDFFLDDKRDQNEEIPYGQQVELCVDKSDVFLLNSEDLSKVDRTRRLTEKLEQHVKLLAGEARYASVDEVLMNLAFSSAHSTKCLKRQVGAVVATPGGEPISVGFNENPDRIKPCIFEFGECYRDRLRNDHFATLAAGKAVCPTCGEPIGELIGPPWRCSNCSSNLETRFFPDRAMNWCTALHAEERAIINAAGRDLRGTTIYTTAFPCFLCAEKILQAGITKIVFADPYPDIYSAELLEHAEPGMVVERFEGVRSGSFDRIFGPIRKAMEEAVDQERRKAFEAVRETATPTPPSDQTQT
jgi:deoxycytidylate deaminase